MKLSRFAGVAVILVCLAATAADTAPIRVMSFNIRTLSPDDGQDFWTFRKGEVAALILRHDPDLLGMQEVYTLQARDLEMALPAYAWFGPPRDDGKKRGERCPIFYKKDRFDLLDHGAFWLSETPDVPGSRSWDSACRRLVTWGKFSDRKTGAVFTFFNTHFDHMGKTAREKSAGILIERVEAIAQGTPVIVTGDFNCTPDSFPYTLITTLLDDARQHSATPPTGPEATSWSFKPGDAPKNRIDYIFIGGGIKVLSYASLPETYSRDRRPSDHVPIMAEVEVAR